MPVTASALRNDIYNILDSILETGEPVEIERKGRVLRIVADRPAQPRSRRIRSRPEMINGSADDIAEMDWSRYWKPGSR